MVRARRWHAGRLAGAGVGIYFKSIGRGMPLLLLHGGPGADHSDFLPAFAGLARRFRLILIDERGSGRSDRAEEPSAYTLDNMVEDIECVRRHLKLPKFVLLGHSFGGLLAQAYAIRHPRRLAGLVLAGTASSARDIDRDFRRIRRALDPALRARLAQHEQKGIFKADGAYVAGYARAAATALAPYMYVQPSRQSRRRSAPLGMEVLREMWVRRSDFKIDGNLKGFDFASKLSTVNVPSLVVIGDHDLVSLASAARTRASLAQATLVVMAGSGHMMFVDQRARFMALMEDFMATCASR